MLKREDAADCILQTPESAMWMTLEAVQSLGGNGYINEVRFVVRGGGHLDSAGRAAIWASGMFRRARESAQAGEGMGYGGIRASSTA